MKPVSDRRLCGSAGALSLCWLCVDRGCFSVASLPASSGRSLGFPELCSCLCLPRNLVSDKQDSLAQCADFRSSLPSQDAMLCSGPLAIIQGRTSKYVTPVPWPLSLILPWGSDWVSAHTVPTQALYPPALPLCPRCWSAQAGWAGQTRGAEGSGPASGNILGLGAAVTGPVTSGAQMAGAG